MGISVAPVLLMAAVGLLLLTPTGHRLLVKYAHTDCSVVPPPIPNATLRYFDVRGLGEVCRLALEEAGVPYTQELYTDATWPAAKAAGLADGSLPFGQVPALSTGDGARLVQSQAIVKYVARRAGFACGSDVDSQTACDVVAMGASDLRKRLSDVLYNAAFSEATRAAFFDSVAPTWLGYFEALLPAGSVYFVGNRFSWADLVVFDVLDGLEAAAAVRLPLQGSPAPRVLTTASGAAVFPKLAAFMAAVRARPRVAAYLASPRRLPYYMPRLPLPPLPEELRAWASALIAQGPVLTAAAPGPWADKTATHPPVAVRDGSRVAVHVPHEMNAGARHFIAAIVAADAASGAVVGVARFTAEDPAPARFEFDHEGPVAVYALCNKHGLWRAAEPV